MSDSEEIFEVDDVSDASDYESEPAPKKKAAVRRNYGCRSDPHLTRVYAGEGRAKGRAEGESTCEAPRRD
jgi:hypothetical protein